MGLFSSIVIPRLLCKTRSMRIHVVDDTPDGFDTQRMNYYQHHFHLAPQLLWSVWKETRLINFVLNLENIYFFQ